MNFRLLFACRTAPVAAALLAAGCMAEPAAELEDDLGLESAESELTRRDLQGQFQLPICAGGGSPPDFRDAQAEMIGIHFLPNNRYEAIRPSHLLDEECAPGGRCLSVEPGRFVIRNRNRLILRPDGGGTPREYDVFRGFAIQLSRTNDDQLLLPNSIAGEPALMYPRHGLFRDFCHDCADSQRRVRDEQGNWSCQNL